MKSDDNLPADALIEMLRSRSLAFQRSKLCPLILDSERPVADVPAETDGLEGFNGIPGTLAGGGPDGGDIAVMVFRRGNALRIKEEPFVGEPLDLLIGSFFHVSFEEAAGLLAGSRRAVGGRTAPKSNGGKLLASGESSDIAWRVSKTDAGTFLAVDVKNEALVGGHAVIECEVESEWGETPRRLIELKRATHSFRKLVGVDPDEVRKITLRPVGEDLELLGPAEVSDTCGWSDFAAAPANLGDSGWEFSLSASELERSYDDGALAVVRFDLGSSEGGRDD